MGSKHMSCADTAKLVRKALASNFPDVTFRVRSSTYSGGASIHVDYLDGPPEDQVRRAVAVYQGADFDGMQDLKTYRDPLLMAGEGGELREVRSGADFIFADREYTLGAFVRALRTVCERWGVDPNELRLYVLESLRFPGVLVSGGLITDPRLDGPTQPREYLSTLVHREIHGLELPAVDYAAVRFDR